MLCKLAILTFLVSMAGFAVGAPHGIDRSLKRRDVNADIQAAIEQALQNAEALATDAIAAGVPTFSISLATTIVEPAGAPIATGAA
ncbi:hypothetical protein C8F04DRAFT_1103190 [Mycena alexandri]|uniref:Uncharacterized protein n=1 Tax=Mycena alexandri TaxID=1745969 RepID=A0AAD6SUB2_9AGAR|nr:hypothetical protein C8F04DRAFT_1103190 [Mycena alexandri]